MPVDVLVSSEYLVLKQANLIFDAVVTLTTDVDARLSPSLEFLGNDVMSSEHSTISAPGAYPVAFITHPSSPRGRGG